MKFAGAVINMNANAERTYDVNGGRFSIQLAWNNVTGTANGSIVVAGTNSTILERTVLATIPVDTISNMTDCALVSVAHAFETVVVTYTRNSITGGSLSINGSVV